MPLGKHTHHRLPHTPVLVGTHLVSTYLGPGLLCSNFYLLCFLAVLKKLTHYAQYYAHNYFNYATAQPQILLFK